MASVVATEARRRLDDMMSNDERTQDVSGSDSAAEADTARIHGSPLPPSQTPPGRWARVTVPARQHPIGVAAGSALVGLVVGLLGGLAVDAHPMMSFTVGTAAAPGAYDRPGPGGPPPPDQRGGPGFDDNDGPPPPPPHHHGHPGPGGPDGPDGPSGGAPRPGQQPPPPPEGGAPTPPTNSGPAQPTGPGAGTPQSPPLPAERGGTT